MKNIFRFLMAVAVLFTASCAKEDISSSIAGGEVEVTFTANLPELGTRAYGEGEHATTLKFFVYEYENENVIGKYLPDVKIYKADNEEGTNVITSTNKHFDFSLTLIKGMKYNIVFWADKGEYSPYSPVLDTNGAPTGVIKANYSDVYANDDSLDAFFGSLKNFDPAAADAQSRAGSIELKRPFAQLNAKTTDLTEIQRSGATLFQSALAVKAYTTLDLFSGNVGGLDEDNAVVFKPNSLPDSNGHISMNYLLAPTTKCTADVTLSYTFVGAEVDFPATTYSYVPLQRNYRTNIIGKLLTAGTNFTVSIEADFATAENTIFTAFEKGGEVTLTEDITIAEPLVVAAGVKAVLNLNGHNIINTTASEVFGEGEGIIAYGDLTINGTGTVQGTTMAVWARGNNGAKVTINGGTYKGCAEGFAFGGRSVIYASSGNVITINGGTFESLAADKTSYANKIEGVYAALNVADNNGSIIVKGGSFYKQNPAAPGTEPAAWNAAHPNGFVAEGHIAIENGDGTWTVHKGAIVNDATEFAAAVAEGGTVVLNSDINLGTNGLEIENDVVLNFEENTLTAGGGTTKTESISVFGEYKVEVNDANVTGGSIMLYYGADVTLNNTSLTYNYTASGRNMVYAASDNDKRVVVTIDGGEYKMTGGSGNRYICAHGNATVYVKGGSFSGKPEGSSYAPFEAIAIGSYLPEIIVTGGTFNFDPSAFVPATHKATQNGSVWTVSAL